MSPVFVDAISPDTAAILQVDHVGWRCRRPKCNRKKKN
jgi:hypothetical protein